ncbi:MAG: tryptophan-rich sensory protein [Eubacteriales bacterium]|nr:tryptophan-rich sensory protein [Eubacteriales bacterium]
MSRTKKAWINLAFLVLTLAVNTLGATGLINGLSQKQISDRYLTLITPSPATFSIWGVIYSLLFISMIVIIVKKNDPYYQKAVDRLSTLYRISCLFNIVWIVAFSYVLVELSTLFILGFVITLALLGIQLLKIHEGRRWLLPLSFGLYSGWLFIATVVNAAAALVKLKWNRFGLSPEVWGILMLSVSIVLLIGVLLKLRNAVFPLPVAWAYYGINQFLKAGDGFGGAYGGLETAAIAGMAVLVVVAIVQFILNRFSILPKQAS